MWIQNPFYSSNHAPVCKRSTDWVAITLWVYLRAYIRRAMGYFLWYSNKSITLTTQNQVCSSLCTTPVTIEEVTACSSFSVSVTSGIAACGSDYTAFSCSAKHPMPTSRSPYLTTSGTGGTANGLGARPWFTVEVAEFHEFQSQVTQYLLGSSLSK